MTINTEKLASRKLWVMLGVIVVLAVDVPLNLMLDPDIKKILASSIPTWLLAQGIADKK